MAAVANHNPDNSHLPQGGSSGGPSHATGNLGKRFQHAVEKTTTAAPAVVRHTVPPFAGNLAKALKNLVLPKLG